jgi:hypothetical protein
MSKVILSIDGKEVYTTSTSSSTSTTPHVQYTPVINPQIGNNYYYIEKYTDDDGKPVYKESKLEKITSVPDGQYTFKPIYEFSDGHKATYTIFKLDTSLGGGNPEEENYESREKKEYLPERNFEYN